MSWLPRKACTSNRLKSYKKLSPWWLLCFCKEYTLTVSDWNLARNFQTIAETSGNRRKHQRNKNNKDMKDAKPNFFYFRFPKTKCVDLGVVGKLSTSQVGAKSIRSITCYLGNWPGASMLEYVALSPVQNVDLQSVAILKISKTDVCKIQKKLHALCVEPG